MVCAALRGDFVCAALRVSKPPRAYATRKKLRREVECDELRQALLRMASQPSTEQPSANTTGAGLPVRSILSWHAIAEATISGTQASSSNKKRGVVTGKKTVAIVRTSGKSRVAYNPAIFRPPKEDPQELADTRRCSYSSGVHTSPGPVGVVMQSLLGRGFSGMQMAQIRASEIKKTHIGGAKAFVLRAHDLKQKGDQAPHLTTYVEAYKKYDPNHVVAVQSARIPEVEKMMADLPPIDKVSDGMSPASASALVLSYETHVFVLEIAVGPSRGTSVSGLGSGSAKLPRKRGP
ncbi:hypothetical protein LguiA_012995 [Lonicera macranthoides]